MANIIGNDNGIQTHMVSPNPSAIAIVNGRLQVGTSPNSIYIFGCGLTVIHEETMMRISENGVEQRIDYVQCGGKAAAVAQINAFLASCVVQAVQPPPPPAKAVTAENHAQFKSGQTIDKAFLISQSNQSRLFSVDISVNSSDADGLLIRDSNNGNLGTSGTATGTNEVAMKWLDPNNANDFGTSSSSWEGLKYSDDTLEECSDFKFTINAGVFSIAWTTFEQ